MQNNSAEMPRTRVAVVQPHYLPWIGYMALMDLVDIFVFYDNVQFSHQSWQQRNKIMVNGKAHWLTIPIIRNGKQLIREVEISRGIDWKKDHRETIRQNYSNHPFYTPYVNYIMDMLSTRFIYLSDMTIYCTKILAHLLNIRQPKFIAASDYRIEGEKTDKLLQLLHHVKATDYYSGLGAKDYLEEDKFTDIKLHWFDYKHPVYPHKKEFIPYLSSVDLLFNTGEDAINYIRKGRNDTI